MTMGAYFHTGPFDWDRDQLVVSVRRRTWIWKLIVAILCAYGAFTWARLAQRVFWYGDPLVKSITHIYFAISSFYFGIMQVACLLHGNEQVNLWITFLQFDRKYSRKSIIACVLWRSLFQ